MSGLLGLDEEDPMARFDDQVLRKQTMNHAERPR
jgi:hypothetical protein